MTTNLQSLLPTLQATLPIWILCGGALLCLLIEILWPQKMANAIYATGVVTLLVTLWAVWQQWVDPQAVSPQSLLVIDHFTLFFMLILGMIGILSLFNALAYIKIHHVLTAEFCALMLFSMTGMVFLFASDHLIINFIGLEVMSLPIYVLVGSHKTNLKSNEAALKYFITGGVASAILLYGIALFYGAFGSFSLRELSQVMTSPELVHLPQMALGLMLVGLFFKMAVVPFHFWSPDVYEGAPAPVTGFMATAVKTAVVGLIVRIFLELDVLASERFFTLLSVITIATLLVGNLLALIQENVKRMLAYSSISHAGFLLLGILAGFENGVYQPQNASVLLFYLIGYFLMTLGAFAVLSLMSKEHSEACDFSDLKGLGRQHPILAGIFSVFMFSLIGIPGTIGFATKFSVLSLAVSHNHIALALIGVIASLISVYYYLRPSVMMFFYDQDGKSVISEIPWTVNVSLSMCGSLVIFLGINPDTIIRFAEIAATSLK